MFKFKIKRRILILPIFAIIKLFSQNPIVANKGLNDPHIHIFKDTAYVYASHDKSINNTKFIMEDWWVWSSPDLVNWTKRSTLKPKDTYIGKEFQSCWATDVGEKNGKYYWYFSESNQQTGVVVGNTPVGPWIDPLGKPLLDANLTPTDEYDMAIFEDNGTHYIIFGVWDYYIAKLNEDMISLAEEPRKIIINNPRGPYNLDGNNKEKPTDDKPFVHKYNGKYYLSWGCFYAMANNVYGPYDYKNTIIKKESFAKGYDAPTWPTGFLQGRHGSFFEWHNQWYFAYCDISQTGNRYFRDTFISYVHYKDNGEIAIIRVDGVGVANYPANLKKIEFEDYFKSQGFIKSQYQKGFIVSTSSKNNHLYFPNIYGLTSYSKLKIKLRATNGGKFLIKIHQNDDKGLLLGQKEFELKSSNNLKEIIINLKSLKDKDNFFFLVKSHDNQILQLDSFAFLL